MGYQERRAKLIANRAAPHLEPGEQIQTGFIAQTGSMLFTTRVWTIVVTDRAILVIRKGQAERGPRDVVFGTPTGLYHTIHLDRDYQVHRDYYHELRAADQALHQLRQDDPDQQ